VTVFGGAEWKGLSGPVVGRNATGMLDNTANVSLVQTKLGHDSIAPARRPPSGKEIAEVVNERSGENANGTICGTERLSNKKCS
jgi:hypothetical protein